MAKPHKDWGEVDFCDTHLFKEWLKKNNLDFPSDIIQKRNLFSKYMQELFETKGQMNK